MDVYRLALNSWPCFYLPLLSNFPLVGADLVKINLLAPHVWSLLSDHSSFDLEEAESSTLSFNFCIYVNYLLLFLKAPTLLLSQIEKLEGQKPSPVATYQLCMPLRTAIV